MEINRNKSIHASGNLSEPVFSTRETEYLSVIVTYIECESLIFDRIVVVDFRLCSGFIFKH